MSTTQSSEPTALLRAGLTLVAALMLSAACLTGCSAIKKEVEKKILGKNYSSLTSFTSKVKAPTSYEVTYVTTGRAPATIELAAAPPNSFFFEAKQSNGSVTEIVESAKGEYFCSPPSSSSKNWSCTRFGGASATAYKAMFDVYTGDFWNKVITGYAFLAPAIGVKFKSTSMNINGFSMSCIDVEHTSSVPGGTFCVTSQGLLGYVKATNESTSFEIKSFTASPSSSLFQTPAGATITTLPTTPTTTSS
jgi:hypothetical protein